MKIKRKIQKERKPQSISNDLLGVLQILQSNQVRLEWRMLVTERIIKDKLGLTEQEVQAMVNTIVEEQRRAAEPPADQPQAQPAEAALAH